MDQINLTAWTGRMIEDEGQITAASARLIHATLGETDRPAPAAGDALPPLWHWCAFPPDAPMEALGADGHPRGSDLMPPMPLNRRMWAGGALQFHAPLRVGDRIRRRSSLRAITQKEGAAGPMVLATVDHVISGPNGPAIEERQDIVYLNIPDSYTPPRARPIRGRPVRQLELSETLLFRYSALTFNAHRIHYDLAYTREVEKYPDLVVHGPLQATLLMAEALRHRGRPPASFDFRGVHPMFAGAPGEITLEDEDGGLSLYTGQDGHQCMAATALWMDTV